ncbi:MAG: tRNA 4-thiouridine(8) synthase ThiI [Zetaproteobacteria bacterium CG02_land_8_20_14_3_00_50_9]|nr:MAG: tRNA 4-thiouridine(8) synthase ThiI [Zetaproteobacteria bacterium CG17_big_fil_post_rev_8_21_14_2_50_50_13]PIV30473.1 MAG: tRNA 4-thiouridine(8) synthase ThiI [Zetaproteobacteria bacterium CG02_land_8_20_14_3_00_50_9]PIY54895.1 MAG: tRNA 4-thiouridine(8) synthase ThiI [Zetaproteobacteria bacterium CG_4_10_14_0_8_um_filter_49_80]
MQYILLHFGEMSLKGKNRKRFERIMANNIKTLLKPESIQQEFGRMLLAFESVDQPLLDYIALIPGIRNFSVVHQCDNTVEAMQQTALALLRASYEAAALVGRRFRVNSRRGDKLFPLTSPELNYEVGGYLKQELQLAVDLKNPEITVHVEVTQKGTYVYANKYQGIGGLPVSSSGRGVVLFSGGIDSPVAAYMMMKRGMEVVLVHCYNSQINRDFGKIKALAAQLSKYQGKLKLILVDLEEFQRHAIATTPADYRMIIYKRQMIRSASDIAAREHASALVTGDSLGQVASQTLANIQAIYDATSLPLLPPLIAFDKEDIIKLARQIGTYEPSIEEYCDICSFLIAKHPQTKGKQSDVNKFEQVLPCEGLERIEKTLYFSHGEESLR